VALLGYPWAHFKAFLGEGRATTGVCVGGRGEGTRNSGGLGTHAGSKLG
jgi:hypothetical protein